MYAIFGLGNPGGNYKKTYHNAGFMVLDELAKKHGTSFSKKKCMAEYAEVIINDQKVMLFKPLTYMNNSGYTVKNAMKKFKLKLNNILIVFDDIDTKVGELRLKQGGGAGGQNGMKSIIADLGTNEFARLRIGIGSEFKGSLSDYVLSNIQPQHQEAMKETLAKSVAAIGEFVNQNGDVNRVRF